MAERLILRTQRFFDKNYKIFHIISFFLNILLLPFLFLFVELEKTGTIWERLCDSWFLVIFAVWLCLTTIYKLLESKTNYRVLEIEKDSNRNADTVSYLQNSILDTEQSIIEILESQLQIIAENLKLGESERISLYKNENESFILLGRYSQNPGNNKHHREIFPETEGFLHKGWNRKEYSFYKPVPNYESHPKEYLDLISNECNIDIEVLADVGMKSRSYYTYPIYVNDNKDRKALILIESTQAEINYKELISTNKKNSMRKRLKSFVKNMIFTKNKFQ